jgi:3-hydroxyisobutyrate dehydrogenase-like beta-hydroxyacid dehydrogenase
MAVQAHEPSVDTGPAVGVIGLGEAGSAIAAGLREDGTATVRGFDTRSHEPRMAARLADADISVVDDLAGLTEGADVVLALTTASSARSVAEAVRPHLGAGQVYADLNSGSPQLKRDVAEIVAPSGCLFVDGAVMSAVPPLRHRVPILLSGPGAQTLLSALDRTGMHLTVVGDEPGTASAVKMFRSLLVKGLEAVLVEFAVGADHYGVTDRVLASMDGTLPMERWSDLATYLVGRSYEHGKRRAQELREVQTTLEEIGLEALVADGGARRLQWLADLDLDRSGPPPGDLGTILERIREARAS